METTIQTIHATQEFRLVHLADAFVELSERFKHEEHLLNAKPEELMKQFLNGLSVVAFGGWQIIGHLTLWHLHDDWYESGSMWIHPDSRNRGLATQLKNELINMSPHVNVLSTTTNSIAVKMNQALRISEQSFQDLALEIHRATCVCSAEKMQADNFENCQLRDEKCRLFVRMKIK
ncbi:GNAT family N-acetyltransferase [Candidatus Kuenenbacteria bacterium]|nr:GNAT family N-acetyltransferase [Candidatus Kuenenbacteria bacterium]